MTEADTQETVPRAVSMNSGSRPQIFVPGAPRKRCFWRFAVRKIQ